MKLITFTKIHVAGIKGTNVTLHQGWLHYTKTFNMGGHTIQVHNPGKMGTLMGHGLYPALLKDELNELKQIIFSPLPEVLVECC